MTQLFLRYALQRSDGAWFSHPTSNTSLSVTEEWVTSCSEAHLWVDHPSCIAALSRYRKVRKEGVIYVRELAVTTDGQRFHLGEC